MRFIIGDYESYFKDLNARYQYVYIIRCSKCISQVLPLNWGSYNWIETWNDFEWRTNFCSIYSIRLTNVNRNRKLYARVPVCIWQVPGCVTGCRDWEFLWFYSVLQTNTGICLDGHHHHVDRVRLRLWTAAASGPIINPLDDICNHGGMISTGKLLIHSSYFSGNPTSRAI
jgi:hypothetical protein